MKGVKRKAEQLTLAVFGVRKKIIHNGEKNLFISIIIIFFLVYQMCRVDIMLRLCLTFRVFFTLIMLISVLLIKKKLVYVTFISEAPDLTNKDNLKVIR